MVDCFGKSLQIGDTVVWTGKKGSGPIQCKIFGVYGDRVGIQALKQDFFGHYDMHWVTSVNIIKYNEAKQNKPGENLKEGDRVVAMYLGWGRAFPRMIIGTVKKVGRLVSVYSEDLGWHGRKEKGTEKRYTILDPSRVCKLN